MRYKVLEDVSVSNQTGSDTTIKAGTVEATEKNRAALERLEELGLAERLKGG